jgi:hypothetical protein
MYNQTLAVLRSVAERNMLRILVTAYSSTGSNSTETEHCKNPHGPHINMDDTYMYSALPDVYGPLYLISKAQHARLKSWRVGKIVENGFKRMNKKNQICLHHLQVYTISSSNLPL